MIVRPSRYGREARVNVDSLLSFDGLDQYASAGVNPNVIRAVDFDRDFSVSFYFTPNQDAASIGAFLLHVGVFSGNTSSGISIAYLSGNRLSVSINQTATLRRTKTTLNGDIVVGRLYHGAFCYRASDQSVFLYINSIEQSLSTNPSSTLSQSVMAATAELTLGYRNNWGNTSEIVYFPGSLNHISFFNRTLTEPEIKSIHRHGGIIPQSTYAACVAHYVANREGFKLWDVVEQYNWAKGESIVYKTVNVSSGNFSIVVSKQKLSPGQKTSFNGLSSIGFQFQLVTSDTDKSGGTVAYEMRYNSSNSTVSFYQAGSLLASDIAIDLSNNTLMSWQRVGDKIEVSTELQGVIYSYSNVANDSWYMRAYSSHNFSSINIIANWTIGINYVVPSPNYAFSQIRIVRDGIAVSSLENVKLVKLIAYHATLENFTPAQVEGSGQSAYLDFYDKTPLRPFVDSDGDGQYDQPLIEKSSLLPPLQNALRFDAAQNQYASVASFNPTAEKGYTFVVAYDFESFFDSRWTPFAMVESLQNANFHIAVDTSFLEIVNRDVSNQRTSFSGDIKGAVRSGLNMLTVSYDGAHVWFFVRDQLIAKRPFTPAWGLDEINAPLTLNRLDFDQGRINTKYCISGIAKGIITPRQVAEMWNNSLLANPKATWRNLEWQLLPNFNQIERISISPESEEFDAGHNWSLGAGWAITGGQLTSNDLIANQLVQITPTNQPRRLTADKTIGDVKIVCEIDVNDFTQNSNNNQSIAIKYGNTGDGTGVKTLKLQTGVQTIELTRHSNTLGFPTILLFARQNVGSITINYFKVKGHYLKENSPQNHTIQLSGFTAQNLNPQAPAYSLTEINSLR